MNPWQGIARLAGFPADFEILDEQTYPPTKERPQARVFYTIRRRLRQGVCSACGTLCSKIHSTDEVELRDLPAFGQQIHWRIPRFTVRCERCGKNTVEDHWLWRARRQFTWRYECQISRLCEELTNVGVARLELLSDKTVYRIDYELLCLRMERQSLPQDIGPHYSMDEIHFRTFRKKLDREKSVSFVTNLLCMKYRKVIFNAPGRVQASAQVCLLGLSETQRAQAQSFAADLHDDFHLAIRAACPQADIVLDRFHIMKLFNESMNDFRKRQLTMAQSCEEKGLLRGANKWLLLMSPDKMSATKKGLLDELKALNERVVEALLIREQFVSFFQSSTLELAKQRWEQLKRMITEADITELTDFFRRLSAWTEFLWNYFKHRTSSAIIEAVNHKIKAVRGMAYGYRNLHYFQLKILQRVGFLNSRFVNLPQKQGRLYRV
jgi:transposase